MLNKTELRNMRDGLKTRLADMDSEAQHIKEQLAALDVLIKPNGVAGPSRKSTRKSTRKNHRTGYKMPKNWGELRKAKYSELAVPQAMLKTWDTLDPSMPFTVQDMATLLKNLGVRGTSVGASVAAAFKNNAKVRKYYKSLGKDAKGRKVYARRREMALEEAK